MDWDKYNEQFFINPNDIIQQANKHYLEIISNFDLSEKKCLDFGCGSGYWIKLLLEKGAIVSGVDASLIAVERCRLLYPHCLFQLPSVEGLINFPDSYFDFVTACYVFQEIYDNVTFQKTVQEINRVLSVTGKLVVVGNIYPDKRVLYKSTDLGDLYENEGEPSLYRFFHGDTMSDVLRDYFVHQSKALGGYSFLEVYTKKLRGGIGVNLESRKQDLLNRREKEDGRKKTAK